MSKYEESDVVEQLLDAADGTTPLSRADLAALLRRAALDISALRDLVRVRQELAGQGEVA